MLVSPYPFLNLERFQRPPLSHSHQRQAIFPLSLVGVNVECGSLTVMSIKVKPILPVKFKVKAITDELEKFVHELADDIEVDLKKPTRTWNHSVSFDKKVSRSDKAIIGEVTTTNKIYRYLDDGTKVRFAVMTSDFQAKTRPGIIGSFSGKGGFSHLSRVAQPGIEARNWISTLGTRYEKTLARRAKPFLARGVKNSGHAFGG